MKINMVDDFYSIAPQYRTKDKLKEILEEEKKVVVRKTLSIVNEYVKDKLGLSDAGLDMGEYLLDNIEIIDGVRTVLHTGNGDKRFTELIEG